MWFDNEPKNMNQEVRYFSEERRFAAGPEAIKTCFRRSGVISGYVVDRDCASSVATSKFDGSLYYQKYLTANVLADKDAVFIPKILVLCRGTEPYEFGNSVSEKRKHTPGQITTIARLTMLSGVIAILEDLKVERRIRYCRRHQEGLRELFLSLYTGTGRQSFSCRFLQVLPVAGENWLLALSNVSCLLHWRVIPLGTKNGVFVDQACPQRVWP